MCRFRTLILLILIGLLSAAAPAMADDANPSPPELDWFVAADDEGQPGFIVLNGDPIEPVYLTEDFQSMAWSRDGKWLAVVNGDDCFDLRLIDMATWQMRRYLHMFGEEMGHIRTVTWAPDSSRMAYVAWPCEMEMTTTAIQVIDRDFNRLDEVDTFDGTIRRLDWSPDGKQFLILGKRAGETKYNLFTMLAQGGRVRQVTQGGAGLGKWSPDGTRIVYRGPAPGQSDGLYVLHMRTGEVTRIADFAVDVDWSPDGTRILFVRADEQIWQVYPDGTGLTPVTYFGAPVWSVAWAGRPNVLFNPDFEYGTQHWKLQTNGDASLITSASAKSGADAALLTVTRLQKPLLLNQYRFRLEPKTRYHLQFWAYSSRGRDLAVTVQNSEGTVHYGFRNLKLNLTGEWKLFNVYFTTKNFAGLTTDTRLTFNLGPYARNGDLYWIDGVRLVKEEVTSALASSGRPEAIAGSVTAQGVGLAHVHVELVDVESEGMVNQHAVATDPLGGFMFPPIPPGLYEIRVHPPPGYLAPEPIQLLIGPAPNEPLVIETEPASMQTNLPLVVHP